MTWLTLRFNVWESFVFMATNLPSCFLIQFLEQLLKFLVKVWFFSHKRADFWLPNFGFKKSLFSLLKQFLLLHVHGTFLECMTL